MTTNGILLAPLAAELGAAGLDRVNVSLDTLDAASASRHHPRRRAGQMCWRASAPRRQPGSEPVKVNMVVMRGVNDDEALAMAQQSVARGLARALHRGDAAGRRQRVCTPDEAHPDQALDAGLVSNDQVRQQIEQPYGPLEPADVHGSGPAETGACRARRARLALSRP